MGGRRHLEPRWFLCGRPSWNIYFTARVGQGGNNPCHVEYDTSDRGSGEYYEIQHSAVLILTIVL